VQPPQPVAGPAYRRQHCTGRHGGIQRILRSSVPRNPGREVPACFACAVQSRTERVSLKNALIITCLASLLAACGGGGGGGSTPAPAPASPGDTTPLSLKSFQPDTATPVARDTAISATFSEPLSAQSVTGANLRLTTGGTAVAGQLAYDAANAKVSFTPQRPLDLLASYTVTAGTGLRNLSGNGLAAEQSWTFKTLDGNWQGPERIEAADAISDTPQLGVDADGHAVAVWSRKSTSGWKEIQAATYDPASGWSRAASIGVPGSSDAVDPQLRVDGDGNAIAVWSQQAGTIVASGISVWSARYIKGRGWQSPVTLDSALAKVSQLSLVADAAGNGFAAWTKQVVDGGIGIFAARFTVAGGWQAPVRVGTSASTGSFSYVQPELALDSAGNALLVWGEIPSDNPMWFARWQADSGWQPARSLGAPRQWVPAPLSPALAVSGSGQVVVTWASFSGTIATGRSDLWYTFLSGPGGTWSTPAVAETDDSGDAFSARLAVDSDGNFHAVWLQRHHRNYGGELVHRQYTPGAGWGATESVSPAETIELSNGLFGVVADRHGNLMVAWNVRGADPVADNSQAGVFARRYVAGEGWQPLTRLSDASPQDVLGGTLAISAGGSIAAAWTQTPPPASYGPTINGPVRVNLFK